MFLDILANLILTILLITSLVSLIGCGYAHSELANAPVYSSVDIQQHSRKDEHTEVITPRYHSVSQTDYG